MALNPFCLHTFIVERNCGSEEALDEALVVLTSSGGCVEGRRTCTERQASQSSSLPAGLHGSPGPPDSSTRDTPRSTATVQAPTRRDSDRGRQNWARLVAPKKVSEAVCMYLFRIYSISTLFTLKMTVKIKFSIILY